MNKQYEILDLKYVYDNQEQHVFPTVIYEKNDVVLVDCGYPGSLAMIEEQLCAHGIEPAVVTKLLLTHQDDDHMGAAAELKKKYPDIQILASYKEAPYISGKLKNLRLQQGEDLQKQLPDDQKAFGEQFCERYRSLTPVPVDILLYDGDQFDWGGGCEIMATPGHMPGHISIRSLDDGYLVTGDAAVVSGNELIIANPEFCLDRDAAQCSLEKILQIPCRRYLCYHSGVFEA